MEIRDLAFVHAVPTRTSNAGPWDWEASYEMPYLGISAALTALASWLSSKLTRSTIPALRAIQA
jgi:hypothetical protein